MQYDLFSVDDHIIEPPNVWSDRLPAALQEAGPHVVEADGRQFWLFEGRRGETMGLNAVAGKEYSEYSMDPVRYSDMIPGCYDPVERAKDLLTNGVRASVCFPTFPRFAGVTFLLAQDKVLADLCVKAYNDWLIDEWCASVPGMYVPMIIGQLWDPVAMAAEIRRCSARGARAVTFPENPVPLGLPSFSTDHWDPVWDACVETDTVICMHIGTSGVVPMASSDSPFIQGIALGADVGVDHVHGPDHGPHSAHVPEHQVHVVGGRDRLGAVRPRACRSSVGAPPLLVAHGRRAPVGCVPSQPVGVLHQRGRRHRDPAPHWHRPDPVGMRLSARRHAVAAHAEGGRRVARRRARRRGGADDARQCRGTVPLAHATDAALLA